MTKEQQLGKYPIVASNDGTVLYVKRSDALKAMQEHAKQQAIEFAIHYAKSAIQNGYVKPSIWCMDRR